MNVISDKLDYSKVLDDMLAKRAAIDAVIINIQTLLGMEPSESSPPASVTPVSRTATDIPAVAFLGKSIPDAARLYFQIVKRKATSREIADALVRGGMETRSPRFHEIVRSVLDRARKAGGDIVKLDKSYWGLAEWYPSGVRISGAAKQQRRAKRNRRRHSPSTAQHDPAPPPAQDAPRDSEDPPPIGPRAAIIQYFTRNPNAEYSTAELAAALELKLSTVALICSKLGQHKILIETAPKRFRLAQQQPAS